MALAITWTSSRTAFVTTLTLLTLTSAAHAEWTDWLNTDDPGDGLEWELVVAHENDGNLPCPDDVLAIEARRVSDGEPADTSQMNIGMDTVQGFSCIRFNFPGLQLDCDDYEVRFLCPSVEQINLSGIDENYEAIGLSSDAEVFGYHLAQTVSHAGGDAGHIRMTDDFRLRFQESDNGNHTGEDVDIVSFLGQPAAMGIDGEAGAFDHAPSSQSDMVQITFSKSYEQPVLFAQVVSSRGWHPIVAVPVEVRSDTAVIMMAEPTTYDGAHGNETVHWVVIEAGRYNLGDGRRMLVDLEMVTTEDYDSGDMVGITAFRTDSGGYFSEDATVIAAPQQAVVADYLGTRVSKTTIGTDSLKFSVRHMRRRGIEYANNPASTEAEIGYMVIGEGSSDLIAIADPIEATPLISTTTLVASDPAPLLIEQLGATCGVADYEATLFMQGDEWGNNRAGADYSMRTGIIDTRHNGGELWMGAEADANVTLLGDSFTVFDVGAETVLSDQGASSDRIWLEALDGLIDEEWSAAVGFTPVSFNQTLFEASAVFYGVTVSASAVAELGIDVTGRPTPAGANVNVEPFGLIEGEASASIGIWCASAGVVASLTLVRAGVPITASVSLNGSTVLWDLESDLTIESLSGSIDLEVSWCFDSDDYELFSYDGFTTAYPIFDVDGCM